MGEDELLEVEAGVVGGEDDAHRRQETPLPRRGQPARRAIRVDRVSGPHPDGGDAPEDEDTGVTHGSEEEIDEAGDESFPASDAPQWWSGDEPDDR